MFGNFCVIAMNLHFVVMTLLLCWEKSSKNLLLRKSKLFGKCLCELHWTEGKMCSWSEHATKRNVRRTKLYWTLMLTEFVKILTNIFWLNLELLFVTEQCQFYAGHHIVQLGLFESLIFLHTASFDHPGVAHPYVRI
jgi:hypothetical protein